MPEWDDAVDADYDFEHDELSSLDRQERDLSYIWDIFEKEETPIDGVLISREQAESTASKAARLKEHGVYDDPVLSIPEWLPTISDCGAWGYKSLPFPPYGTAEMLDFYEQLEVTVGVTIDHLVLGSGKEKGRLYLDERAFHDNFTQSDIPSDVIDAVDLMIEEWPAQWPSYVAEQEPSLYQGTTKTVEPFTASDFRGDTDDILNRLQDDSRAVYRKDDKQFRYDLTLQNARNMRALYEEGDYSFRLMSAVQGWDADSYVDATDHALELGYEYIGIGGVAGSPIHDVRHIVKEVGKTIKQYEREHDTRIDSHVFGFAKSEAFETVGRSGMSSFDSASMLRSAWTGGDNYRLDADTRYDAIRVQYPDHGADIEDAVETALRGREVLEVLRAYAAGESLVEKLQEWAGTAETTLQAIRSYLRAHRHDEQYDKTRLQDVEAELRSDFEYARKLNAYFSSDFRNRLVKLLRADDPQNPLPFDDYTELIDIAENKFERYPRMVNILEREANRPDGMDRYDQLWFVVQDYAYWIGNEDLLAAYHRTLTDRPWEQCDCPICEEHGVEVCIFRGNDRNRRRGFHNTERFYRDFSEALPKTLVATKGSASLSNYATVEAFLTREQPDFWNAVHDLPVAELGVLDANGIHEWWKDPPPTVSFAPTKMQETLQEQLARYDQLFLYDGGQFREELVATIQTLVDEVQTTDDSAVLRESVLQSLGENYWIGQDFIPHAPVLDVDEGLDILIIDQCSGSKYTLEGMPEFGIKEIDQYSKNELLARDDTRGIAAADLYTGRQQEYITSAVRHLRSSGHNVERYFISAGFGLVGEDESLPPYDVTFSGMRVGQIRARSAKLNIQTDVSNLLIQTDYDIVFFSLGDDYYTSIDIDQMVQHVRQDRIGVVFNRDLVDYQYDNIVSVPARTEDAKRHSTIVIGLKGLYLKNFAQNLSRAEKLDPETIRTLCRYIEDEPVQEAMEKY